MIMRLRDQEKLSGGLPWKGLVILSVGMLFLGWLLNTPEGLLGKADAVGYAVCHRISIRSYFLGEQQFPFCARCSGMYLAAILGLVYQAILAPRRGGMPGRFNRIILGIFVAFFVIDGLNSFVSLIPGLPTLYQPQNWLRLAAGAGMGLVIAALLYPAFNQTVWRNWDARPTLESPLALLFLLMLIGLVNLAMLSQNPILLYPLALVSATSVLLILTLVYSMLLLIVFRRENGYESIVQLGIILVAGFGVAIMQIAFMDFIRYQITGTWDGFHLG